MEKKVFLTVDTYDLTLDGSVECNDMIATHATTEAIASGLDYATTLVFDDGRLVQALNTGKSFRKKDKTIPLPEGSENIVCPDTEPHLPYNLRFTNNTAASWLGGEPPEGFVMPECGIVSFQYLGYLSGSDLHLVFPLYSDVAKLFIDSTDPMRPVVLNTEEVADATTAYGDYIDTGTQLAFVRHEIEFFAPENNKKRGAFTSYCGAGIPNWMQRPTIPHCPRSGKRMEFAVQVCSQMANAIPVESSNVVSLGLERVEVVGTNGQIDVRRRIRPIENEFKRMGFWGSGTLYVFVQPETKVACLFIQNS